MAMHIYPHSTPAPQNPPFITPEEYLRRENATIEKNEYINGTIIPMGGASFLHNKIVSNLNAILLPCMRRQGYEVITTDLRVAIGKNSGVGTQAYLYPDIVIITAEPQLTATNPEMLLNPAVIIEVMSPTTESYDRGAKFENYKRLDSIEYYILIHPTLKTIEVFECTNKNHSVKEWATQKYGLEDDKQVFELLTCTINLKDVFLN